MKKRIEYTINRNNKYLFEDIANLIGLNLYRLSTTSAYIDHYRSTYISFENRIFFYFIGENNAGVLNIKYSDELFVNESKIGIIDLWSLKHEMSSFLSYDNNGFMIEYHGANKFTIKEIEVWGYDYYDQTESLHIVLHTTLVLVSSESERIWVHIATFDDRIEIIYATKFLDFFDNPVMIKNQAYNKLKHMITIK